MALVFCSKNILTKLGKESLRPFPLFAFSFKIFKQNFSIHSVFRDKIDVLKFTEKHEWISLKGKIGTIGITDYAQDKLGEVVYVELPEVGTTLKQLEQFATLESVKAVSECYLPVGGVIIEVNESLKENPIKINKSPFEEGWLSKIEIANKSELDKLMDKKQYEEFLQSEQH